MKCIILIGMPFSGKTTVGKKLSEMLGLAFLDTDMEISKELGMSINHIFKFKGEEYFRRAEQKLIWDLKRVSNLVISTGGGTPVFFENFEELSSLGHVFYLKTQIDVIEERAALNKDRPLLQEDYKYKLVRLYDERCSIYNRAHYKIDTANLSVEEICLQIIKLLELEKINNNNCK